MVCQLPVDCLNEIFEYLEEDETTLHSCLLVNRLWCELSVRILWRDVLNSKCRNVKRPARPILSTLIACLPNESKELLCENKISISTPTSKSPLFNYASFCKVFSIVKIYKLADSVLVSKESFEPSITYSLSFKDRVCLVASEVIKMFMNQITSLKKLTYYYDSYYNITSLTYFPEMRGLSNYIAVRMFLLIFFIRCLKHVII